jgi:esterase/lipase
MAITNSYRPANHIGDYALSFLILLLLLLWSVSNLFSQEPPITIHLNESVEYYNTTSPKKGVTLVVHGLNVKPSAMLDLIGWLNEQGSDACLLKLSGHYANSSDAWAMPRDTWQTEMKYAYDIGRKIASANGVPLFFLGFSLGGLLGPAILSAGNGIYQFDKQLLFAPAIGLRTRSYLVKLSFFFNEKNRLPSFTPEPYRANNKLPILFYKIMFREERLLKKNLFKHVNIPTMVFIDPSDELISYRKLQKLSQKFKLTNFRMVTLDKDLAGRETKYHHLIISERTMGRKNWELVTGEMSRFLFND